MIKARVNRTEGDLVILGVSDGNIERLTDGKPILVRKDDVALDADVVILHGETERAVAAQLIAAGLKIPEFSDPAPGEEKRWESVGFRRPMSREDMVEALDGRLSAFHNSVRFAAPETFELHLSNLRAGVLALLDEVRA